MRASLVLLFALGCPSPETTTPPTETETGCVADLVSVTPADGAEQVAIDTSVQMQFSSPPNGEFTVQVVGVEGGVTVAENGLSAIWVPDAPLEHESTYEVRVTVCDVVTESSFSTLAEPAQIAPGDVYELPFDSLVWNEPSSAGVFTILVEFESFLMEVTDVAPDGASFGAAFTAGWPGGNPECPSTVEVTADYSSNPYFATAEGLMQIPVEDVDPPLLIEIDQLVFEGRFVPGPGLEDVHFEGRIDTRAFDGILGGPGSVCDLAALAGDTCVACADGSESCLMLDVDSPQTVPSIGPGIIEPCGL